MRRWTCDRVMQVLPQAHHGNSWVRVEWPTEDQLPNRQILSSRLLRAQQWGRTQSCWRGGLGSQRRKASARGQSHGYRIANQVSLGPLGLFRTLKPHRENKRVILLTGEHYEGKPGHRFPHNKGRETVAGTRRIL